MNGKLKIIHCGSDIGGRKEGSRDAILFFKKILPDNVEVIKSSVINEKSDNVASLKNALSIEKNLLSLKDEIKKIDFNKNFLLLITGDHTSACAGIKGVNDSINGRLGVIYIDAHADIHSIYTSPSGNLHGMPLSIATNEDNVENAINNLTDSDVKVWERLKKEFKSIDIKDLVFFGLRSVEESELNLISKKSVPSFDYPTINRLENIEKLVEDAFTHLSDCDSIYVSFDVDSLDPKYFDSTGCYEEGGISSQAATKLFSEILKNSKVKALEISEVNPHLGNNERSLKTLEEIFNGKLK